MNDQKKCRIFLVIILTIIVPLSLMGLLYPYPISSVDVFRPIVEIPSAVCEQKDSISTGEYWKITVQVKNSDYELVEFSHLFVDDVPVSLFSRFFPVEGEAVTSMPDRCQINPGYTRNYDLYLDGDYGNLTSGKPIVIKMRSLSGMEYLKLVRLTCDVENVEWRSNH